MKACQNPVSIFVYPQQFCNKKTSMILNKFVLFSIHNFKNENFKNSSKRRVLNS